MAVGTSGEEISPSDFVDVDFDSITLGPTPSSSSQVITFNGGYAIYSDNIDNGGGSGTRWWLDTPDNADIVIGPRAGGNAIAGLRLRTDATTASAANMFISSTTFAISRSTSSRKYKQDITPAEVDEDAFLRMSPVHYRGRSEVEERARWEAWRDAGRDMSQLDEPPVPRFFLGLIAEDVHALGLHDFVMYRDDTGEPDSLAYDRMIVGAVQILKKQREQIRSLEQRLFALEQKSGKAAR